MSITLTNASKLQTDLAGAFAARHNAAIGDFDISITLTAYRSEKVEGFSISALYVTAQNQIGNLQKQHSLER